MKKSVKSHESSLLYIEKCPRRASEFPMEVYMESISASDELNEVVFIRYGCTLV